MRRLPPVDTLLDNYSFYPFNEQQEIVFNDIMSSFSISEFLHKSTGDTSYTVTYARAIISCIVSYLIVTSSTKDPNTYLLTYDLNDYIDAIDALELSYSDIPSRTERINFRLFSRTISNYINRSLQQFGILFDLWYDVESIDLLKAYNSMN